MLARFYLCTSCQPWESRHLIRLTLHLYSRLEWLSMVFEVLILLGSNV